MSVHQSISAPNGARAWPPRGCISCAARQAAPGSAASWEISCAARSPGGWTSCSCARSSCPTTSYWRRTRCTGAVRAAGGAVRRQRPPARRASRSGADGVHVGQDDMPVARGPRAGRPRHADRPLHACARRDRRRRRDATGGSPLWTTSASGPSTRPQPSPGRPAVGTRAGQLRRRPRRQCRSSRSAACTPATSSHAIDAGARRACVLRAISRAEDPERAARALRELLDAAAPGDALEQAGAEAATSWPGPPSSRWREDERPPALLVAVTVAARCSR